jgi:hypothetical protein
MDALDEQQMIDEQKGHVIDQYFYSFVVGGREIIGCSWAGIKFIVSKMASLGHPIAVSELVIEEGQESYKARAKAKDLATGEERWGVAEQPKVDEKGRRNMFAYPIAASKAQRNALRSFISEVVIQEGYREWKKKRTGITEPTKDITGEEEPAPRIPEHPEEITEKKPPEPVGTTSQAEIPIPQTPSPSQPTEVGKPEESYRVPLANDFLPENKKPAGLLQLPLDHDLRQWGMLNQLQDEISIVPKEPLPYDPEKGPIHWFLEGTPTKTGIVRPICEKWNSDSNHSKQLHYKPVHEGGFLKAIIITGDTLDFQHVKELLNAAWAFHMILEPKEAEAQQRPQRAWSPLPTLANLLKESERSIQKDKETFAIMTIREYDDGHDEFLVTPNYGYLANTGPMQRFLRNTILEPQKARAVQRNSTIPFRYEIRDNNNGLLREIWISCKRRESKEIELNLISPLIHTFNKILHPDESNAGQR